VFIRSQCCIRLHSVDLTITVTGRISASLRTINNRSSKNIVSTDITKTSLQGNSPLDYTPTTQRHGLCVSIELHTQDVFYNMFYSRDAGGLHDQLPYQLTDNEQWRTKCVHQQVKYAFSPSIALRASSQLSVIRTRTFRTDIAKRSSLQLLHQLGNWNYRHQPF